MFLLRSLLLFGLVFLTITVADKRAKRYVIDLDEEPEHRWDDVIRDHIDSIPQVAVEARKIIPKFFQPVVWWFAEKVGEFLPEEYVREMKGIARESGLPLGEIVGLNILYDITAFDRKHILNEGCTSIVAEDEEGRIWHGRNLDYEMGGLLRNITVLLDFKKGGKTLYSGATFALYNGLLTGQRPYSYTVSLNARYSGAYIDNILMEIYTRFRRPVALFIREVLESESTFSSALQKFSSTPLISPSYIILGGTERHEGAVISRSRLKAADVYSLEDDRWFLVETNFDHWKKDEDERRTTAQKVLKKLGKKGLNEETMTTVLNTRPVRNDITIYRTVLSAKYPQLFFKTFMIVE